ncbi:Flagella basal body P-ring formation protein FlgA (modular protein) [Vibrio chagasii]|nr:Flagella basal body P-ring formation protein FlgA (modular protein) [Vibrio chagasii]
MLSIKRTLQLLVLPILLTTTKECLAHSFEYVDSKILEHISSHNVEVVINHAPTLEEYISSCASSSLQINVSALRNRYDRYRVTAFCEGTDNHSSITQLTGTIETFNAKRSIRRKTPITKDLIGKKPTNIETVRGTIATNVPDFYYSAKGNITSGDVIYKKHLITRPTIERGDLVNLEISIGGVNLQVKGASRESGMVGQRIEIENLSSNKIIVGEVIDHNTVRVN